MSAVVIAAKALYDQLNLMGEASIDGDSFLDLWVYVIIKANIPELVDIHNTCSYITLPIARNSAGENNCRFCIFDVIKTLGGGYGKVGVARSTCMIKNRYGHILIC